MEKTKLAVITKQKKSSIIDFQIHTPLYACLIKKMLPKELQKEKSLHENQYGLLREKSTIDAINRW